MAQDLPSADPFSHLETARKLTLGDAAYYSQIVPAILPTLAYENNATVDVRRWGAEFLAETFASPALSDAQKEELCLVVLPFVRGVLDLAKEDALVVKNTIQAVSSFYTVLFRSIVTRPDEFFASKPISSKANAWQLMSAIKSSILRRMDSAPSIIGVCAIKFIQKVVQVQTPGVIADPRRPEKNETSITIVSRHDLLLKIPLLEAEASGLLDRLLNVFQENSSDAVLVDATLNCLAVLIRSRPTVAGKIINAILNFNPLKLANSPLTPRSKVIAKSLERTTSALLKNIKKNNPSGPFTPRIDSYLAGLSQSRASIFTEAQSLKRPAVIEGPDGLEAKRLRMEGTSKFPSMPPPPNSYAQLYTLTQDPAFMNFNVQILNQEMIKTIAQLTLYHVDSNSLNEAIAAVRERYSHLQKIQQPTPLPDIPMAGPTGLDDEDDYDPEYVPDEDLQSPITATAQALHDLVQPDLGLGPFELSRPPPLTSTEVSQLAKQSVDRVFSIIPALEAAPPPSTQKLGLNRLAASTNDRDAWVTILTRLATRAPSGLDDLTKPDDTLTKSESHTDDPTSLANTIRQSLYLYILDDFRSRLPIAISWLNEEWYSERLTSPAPNPTPTYTAWTTRLLDAILPYLDARDNRLLIRFLSEIPAISRPMLERVSSLARDPERVNMCVMALQYLIMMRPPVRTAAIDTLQMMAGAGDEFGEARGAVEKALRRWRPDALEQIKRSGNGSGSGSGSGEQAKVLTERGKGQKGTTVDKVNKAEKGLGKVVNGA